MAGKLLGQIDIAAVTNTDIYTVPTTMETVFTASICNRNSVSVKVRLALSSVSVTPAGKEYIEYDTTVPGNGVLERTGLVIDVGKIVIGYSDTANVSFNVYGYEEVV